MRTVVWGGRPQGAVLSRSADSMIRQYREWFNREWAKAAHFDAEGRWHIHWPMALLLIALDAIVPFAAVSLVSLTIGGSVGLQECGLVAIVVGWFAMERLLPDPDRDPRLRNPSRKTIAEPPAPGDGSTRA